MIHTNIHTYIRFPFLILAPSVPTGPEFTISTPTQEPGDEDIATDTTIRIEFVIPEELNRNGPVQRVRIVVRIFGSSNDTIDIWYNSFNSRDSESAPPYQAVEVDIEENRKRGLVRRQEVMFVCIEKYIHLSINLPIYLSIYLFICPSIRPSLTHSFIHSFIHPSIHPILGRW